MLTPTLIEHNESPLYAVIDLGSNSFHMLVTRQLANSVQVVDKVKRKVRLAAGLNSNNTLSSTAMAKGLECLRFFAERLQDIPSENIRIVATATLRLATNRADFIRAANDILGHNITLLSGLQEAENIYLGVAHTSCSAKEKLVLDIGGASTELIIGHNFTINHAASINMGCVTFNQRFFNDGVISEQRIDNAINFAEDCLAPHAQHYITLGWKVALGGSGTMQALAEILMFDKQPAIITADYLARIKVQLQQYSHFSDINIAGLTPERTPVFVSGVCILMALFNRLDIKQLQLSSGALREGLLYEMLPNSRDIAIRQRTINALSVKFHIDDSHVKRVKKQALALLNSTAPTWQIIDSNTIQLFESAIALHEIGLLIEYKRHQQHGEYLVNNSDMPGFEQAERQFIAAMVRLYKGEINVALLNTLSAVSVDQACYLLALLRIAIILCRRRQDDTLPEYQTTVEKHTLCLCLPNAWLAKHPLIADELQQESEALKAIGITFSVSFEQGE